MNLNIDIVAKFAQFQDSLDQTSRKATKFTNDLSSGFNKIKEVMGKLGIGLGALTFANIAKQMVAAVNEAEKASNRLTGTIKATGSAAGVTKQQIDDLADALAKTTQFDDESIRNAASELLVFRNVQKEVFTDTLKLSTDVAAAMGTTVPEAAAKLGRSLEDPETAFGLLRRQGVLLTEQQKDQIKALGELGDKAGQQRLILERLKQAYGGLAAELNTGVNKGVNDVKKGWDELLESFGKSPAIQSVTAAFLDTVASGLGRVKAMLEGDATWIDRLKAVMTAPLAAPSLLVLERFARGRKSAAESGAGTDAEDASLGAAAGAAGQRQAQLDEAAYVRQRDAAKKAQEERDRAAKESIKNTERLLETYRSKLRGIGEEMLKLEEIDSDFLKMKSLIAGDKQFTAMRRPEAEKLKKDLLGGAEALDLRRDILRQNKELEEGLAADEKARGEARNKEIADLAALASNYKDLADPLRVIAREHQKIDELVGDGVNGWISKSVGETAKLSSELRALLQPVKNIHDEIQQAWERGRISTEQMHDAMLRVAPTFEKAKSQAEDFGHAISTAFEDAVIGGKKAIDVAKAFGTTIAQIIFRQQVTKPLEKAIGGLDFSGIFKNLLSGVFGSSSDAILATYEPRAMGGPVAAGGRYLVGETGPELFVPGMSGAIVPAGGNTNIYNSYHIDSRTDRAEIGAAIRQSEQRTIAQVADMTRRGGGYSKAVRG